SPARRRSSRPRSACPTARSRRAGSYARSATGRSSTHGSALPAVPPRIASLPPPVTKRTLGGRFRYLGSGARHSPQQLCRALQDVPLGGGQFGQPLREPLVAHPL